MLPHRCASCGQAIPGGKSFCGHCGQPTQAGARPPAPVPIPVPDRALPQVARDERRLVSVLFCDLVGFTPLTERADAEQVRAVQLEYFERMSAEIARFGGTVEKFAGDAVLALFGIPIATGDDAERAVLCALGMQQAMTSLSSEISQRYGIELAIRVGVNTGEAVGGLLDAGGRQDLSVTGDVVNTAARLQSAAEPGGVMAGAETMRLARKRIRFGERRELTLKGKSGTVAAYQVLSVHDDADRRSSQDGHRTPLVGREHEVGMLIQAWERARSGEGQMMSLVADAGLGKTRLLDEAGRLFVAEGRQAWGRCVSYGQDMSLGLVASLLRSLLGCEEQESEPVVRERLRALITRILSSESQETRGIAEDVLSEVLGISGAQSSLSDAGPQARRQALIRTARLLLVGMAEESPLLLVIDDAHWIDSGSAEVLAETLADVPRLRVLVLAAYRPGWSAPWSEWTWAERLNLRPLAHGESVALAQRLLRASSLAPELEAYIEERAGGNPYFIEELLLALEDAGAVKLTEGAAQLLSSAAAGLPLSLTEILLARLDRLDAQTRALVQVAGVIGRSFSRDLLAAVSGWEDSRLQAGLSALVRNEIVFSQPGSRSEYAFRHVTMRDVAYNTLLQADRQRLHLAAGRALTALYPDDEPVELIAYHFSRTEAHADAALWMERAGDRSAGVFDNQTAISQYEEARRRLLLAEADAPAAARIAEKLGTAFRVIAWYDESLEELESAAQRQALTGDVAAEARLVAQIGRVHFLRGAPLQAIDRVQQLLLQLDDIDDDLTQSPALARLYLALVDPFYSLNRFEDALTAGWRALELARESDDRRLVAEATVGYGLSLQGIGRLDEARTVLEEAIPLAESAGDLSGLAQGLLRTGDISLTQGHPEQAREYYRRALQAAENQGDLGASAALLGRLGDAAFVLGDWDDARARYERAVETVRSISFSYFSASTLMALGEHYLREGAFESAARYLEEPLTLAAASGQTSLLPYLQIPMAAWDLWNERPHEALRRLEPLLGTPVFETSLDHRAMQIAAEAYLAMEDARAGELIARGLDQATGQGNQLARLGWLQIAGLAAAPAGRDGEGPLGEALALARSMPHAFEEGMVLYRRGVTRGGRGGREDLIASITIFDQLGARPFAERARRELDGADGVPDLVAPGRDSLD